MTLLILVLLILASFRITQFFVWDSLMGFNTESGSSTSMWLDRFAYHDDGTDRTWLRGKVGDLLSCPRCLGFWISLGVYALWVSADRAWDDRAVAVHVIMIFAVAGGQIILDSWFNRDD